MKGNWCKWGVLALAVVSLLPLTTAQAQQTALDRIKAQAPSVLSAAPGKNAGAVENSQTTQTMSMKRFAKASGGTSTSSLPGEAKKPENAYYFIGASCVLMNDPNLRPKLVGAVRGALQFVQAPQQLQDAAAAANDQNSMQAFTQNTWQWVQSQGQNAMVNFFAGAWTGSNFFALAQNQTYKLEVAKDLAGFYGQTGPQQAAQVLNGIFGFSQKQLAGDDFKQVGQAFSQLFDILS